MIHAALALMVLGALAVLALVIRDEDRREAASYDALSGREE